MLMSKGLDEGDILEQTEENILDSDTNETLRKRLVAKSRKILPDILEKWINGGILPAEQDNSKATYCWQKDISKENAEIDWEEENPEYIERKVRAMVPWPVAWTMMNGKRMKIFKAEVKEIESCIEPGEVFIDEGSLYIGTKDASEMLKIEELQIEGKNKTKAEDYIRGLR